MTYPSDFDNFLRQMSALPNGIIGKVLACLVSEKKSLEESPRPNAKLEWSKLQCHLVAKRLGMGQGSKRIISRYS